METVHREKRVVLVAALAIVAILLSSSLARPDAPPSRNEAVKGALPRMVDLGRNQCAPCKMMAPILEELKREYTGIIDIEFINVADNPDAMSKLGLPVRAVPFQIFYDASGKIVKQHYGYMSRDEILKAFKELGFGSTKTKTQGK